MDARGDGSVLLVLSPDARNARVARAVAVACASFESFDVDDLVDVRLLMDEVFHAVTALSQGPVTLAVRPFDGTLGLEMRAVSHGTMRWTHPHLELARRVISSTCATAAFGEAEGVVWFEAQLQAMQR